MSRAIRFGTRTKIRGIFRTAQELDLMEDSGRYQELPQRERHFRKNVHAFVAAMDGAVSETGVEKFSSEVILLGSRFILRFLKSIVSDHSEEEFQCMRERECVRVESSTWMKISEVNLYVLSHCKGVAFFSGLRCDKISRRIIISLPVPTLPTHTTLPNRPKTIHDCPKLLVAGTLYQRTAILLVNDATGIRLDDVRACYLHPLEYNRRLVRRPHAEVMIVGGNFVVVIPVVPRVASEGGPLGSGVASHDGRYPSRREFGGGASFDSSDCRGSCCLPK